MASRSLGTLTLDLIAKIGGFVRGMDQAERKADQTARSIARQQALRAKEIEKIWSGIGVAIGAAFAGAIASVALINRQINNISGFKGLSEEIGDTAEAVASLKPAADTSEVAMDAVAAASVRLTASLSKTDDESKAVGQAIKALGLEFNAFKSLSPVQQLEAMADAMAKFEDGSEKTAISVALFGKAGAQLIPFLNDLAERTQQQTRLTQEQIEAADQYVKSQAALRSEFERFVQLQVANTIPVMQELHNILATLARDQTTLEVVTGVVNTAFKAAIVIFQTLAVVASDVGFVFLGVGREIGAWAAQIGALARGDLRGFRAISDMVKEDAARARKELDAFQARVMALGSGRNLAADAGLNSPIFNVARPRLDVRGLAVGDSSKDDPTKKLLENQIKGIEALVKREQDLLSDRNKFLNLFNDQGLISIQSYYDAQRAILDASVSAQTALYKKEIDVLRAYQDKKTTSQKDRADAQGKINDLLEKQLQLEQSAGQTGLELSIKQATQMQAFQREIEGVNAQLLEMQGRFKEAAAIRFDAQNRELKLRLTVEGKDEAIKQIDELRKAAISQAGYAEEVTKSTRALDGLAIATERIALEQQKGSITELESLFKIGEERRKSIADLEAIVAAQERIAAASGNEDLILGAQRARLELDKLKASADPLAEKFEDLFGGAFEDSFADFLSGTKSAKDAFKDFANTVVQEISRMTARELTKSLFGGLFSSGGSSGGGFLSGIFGSIFGSGGQWGGHGSIPGRAGGGPVSAGGLYMVGEQGPELFRPNLAGSIIPNDRVGGNNTFNISVNSNGYMDRSAEERSAAMIARSVNERMKRRSA